jgi:excisionase family DNA binding protein
MRILNVKETAEELRVHEMTIYRALKEKSIYAKRMGGRWLIPIDKVIEDLMIKNGTPGQTGNCK